MIPYHVLLCDIGSQFSRFGSVRAPGEPVEILRRLRTADFPDLASAARQAIQDASFNEEPLDPASLLAGIAGPVTGRISRLKHSSWRINGETIAASLGLDSGLMLTDFEALAISLSVSNAGWVTPIGGPENAPARRSAGSPDIAACGGDHIDCSNSLSVQAIIGPGRELGCAALVATGRRFIAMPSEMGHIHFGPGSREDEKIWRYLDHKETGGSSTDVTARTILSLQGLQKLHDARLLAQGGPAGHMTFQAIVDMASCDAGSEAAKTVRSFWRLLARFCSEVALTFSAHNGITLTGPLVRSIWPLLDPVEFRMHFETSGPMRPLLQSIPTRLLTRDDAMMHGLAAIAADPSRYAIDYANREWI
jgi:glucokinase